MRFWKDSATVTLRQLDSHLYSVHNLHAAVRGQGHATAVMQEACDYADENYATLVLSVQAYGHPFGLTNDQLVTFYRKFGFARDNRKGVLPTMTRQPSQELHAS